MSTLERAIEIATQAHKGQLDKAGNEYIGHPLRVMEAGKTTEEKILGVLHDDDRFRRRHDLLFGMGHFRHLQWSDDDPQPDRCGQPVASGHQDHQQLRCPQHQGRRCSARSVLRSRHCGRTEGSGRLIENLKGRTEMVRPSVFYGYIL